MYHLFCNAFVHVIYLGVSGQCSDTIQQSTEHVSILYTCITYFVMHWSMLFIWEYLVDVFIQYQLNGTL